MVSALNSGSSSLDLSPQARDIVWSLSTTLHSHCLSLHPGVQMRTNKFNTGGTPVMNGGVEIFLVTLCYRNQDKLRPDWSLGSHIHCHIAFTIILLDSGIESPKWKYPFVDWTGVKAGTLEPQQVVGVQVMNNKLGPCIFFTNVWCQEIKYPHKPLEESFLKFQGNEGVMKAQQLLIKGKYEP